jgi:hypothetical protein
MPGELDRILQGTHKPKPQTSDEDQQDLDAYVVYPKGAYALDIEDGGKPVISFQYVFLSIWSQFSPGSFWFIFKDGDERVKLTVTGRNLRDLYNRLLELLPTVLNRFTLKPPLFRGLGRVLLLDQEAMRYDPPPLVRLSLTVLVCARLLDQLLPLPVMARVDHITLSLPYPELPWDGYEDQQQALLDWPGLQNLEGVSLSGAPCEAAERLAQRVRVAFLA